MINVILQPNGLDLVNINVYAKVCQNIPNGLRVVGIFRELSGDKQLHKLSERSGDGQVECGPRHSLDQWQMTFDNPLGYILSLSMCMQHFTTIFHSIQEIEPFSIFQNLEFGKASTDDKCHFATSWARSCQYQCVCNSLSKYSKRFKSCGHFSRTVRDFRN